MWVAGDGIDGKPRVVKATAPGQFEPGREEVPANAARQTQSANVSQHVRADERSDVRSTAVRGARTSLDAKPKASSPGNPTPRHQAPRPGEAGGPELPKDPGYDDDLGPSAA